MSLGSPASACVYLSFPLVWHGSQHFSPPSGSQQLQAYKTLIIRKSNESDLFLNNSLALLSLAILTHTLMLQPIIVVKEQDDLTGQI